MTRSLLDATGEHDSESEPKRHLHQISKMIFVDELSITLVLFQQRKHETQALVVSFAGVFQRLRLPPRPRARVDQHTDALLSAGITIKQREKNRQRQQLKGEETSLKWIGADRIPKRQIRQSRLAPGLIGSV